MKTYNTPRIRPDASAAHRAFIAARHTVRANARKRRVGESQILTHSQGADVLRNPIPFTLTEANACNVNPTSCMGGVNPQHDAAQRTFERKDRGTPPTYQSAVRALAIRIAEKHVRQARMRCEHLRSELVTEIESAVGEFIGTRVVRFPVLASDLLARFAIGALPSSTVRALHRCARRACDARMARMAGKSKLVEPSFFNLFCDESAERSSELDTVFVNARVDYLLGLVRERAGTSGNAARAAKAHCALLEQARTYFLASIAGESVALPSAGLTPVSVPVGFNASALRQTKAKAQAHADGERFADTAPDVSGKVLQSQGYVVTESRGTHLANSALYMRMLRMARFVGAPDVVDALARQSRR